MSSIHWALWRHFPAGVPKISIPMFAWISNKSSGVSAQQAAFHQFSQATGKNGSQNSVEIWSAWPNAWENPDQAGVWRSAEADGVRKCNELHSAQDVTSEVCTTYQREIAVLVLANNSLTSSVTGRCCTVCELWGSAVTIWNVSVGCFASELLH